MGEFRNIYLQFAAIGTVADLVPLTGENRLIVQKGLSNLKDTKIGFESTFKNANVRSGTT